MLKNQFSLDNSECKNNRTHSLAPPVIMCLLLTGAAEPGGTRGINPPQSHL